MSAFSGLANSVLTVTASGKHIIANAGTAIAGRIFGKAGFERFNSLPTELAHPANVYKLSDCIKAEVTSMCCGDPSSDSSFQGICDKNPQLQAGLLSIRSTIGFKGFRDT